MFNSLLPQSAPFFKLLLEQNQILRTIAAAVVEILEHNSALDKQHREVATLEAKADNLHMVISRHLSQTFITPIDREDILHINKAQEEAIDQLHNMANRLYIFEFTKIRFPMMRLARTLLHMVDLTGTMLQGLSKRCDSHNTREFRTLRNECEMLLSMGLGELHDLHEPTPANILEVLKWSQAYDRMELALEQVVELAEAIEEAVLKNA